MCRNIKKIIKNIILLIAVGLILTGKAYATESPVLLQSYANDNKIRLIVKASDEYTDVSGQVGMEPVELTGVEGAIDMHTIVLIDNSLSVTDAYMKRVKDILCSYADNKPESEYVSVGVYGEDTQFILEMESDPQKIKEAIESITNINRDTYLTDVLYEDMQKRSAVNSYTRYIVATDGVDNKYIGYTKDELTEYLRNNPFPIYSLGCTYKNNGEELKNLFAISRLTNAGYFLLDDYEDIQVSEGLNDRILAYDISVPDNMKDGSTQSIKLEFTGESGTEILTDEISMPFGIRIEEQNPEEPVVAQPTVIVEKVEVPVEVEATPDVEQLEVENKEIDPFKMIAVILAIAGIGYLVYTKLKSGRKKENKKEKDDVKTFAATVDDDTPDDDDGTVLLAVDDTDGDDDEEHTVLLSGAHKANYILVLKDQSDNQRIFRYPLANDVIIGRKNEDGDVSIVLNYEKSISSKHCVIRMRNDELYIEDLNSSNGTFVNRAQVIGEVRFKSGDVITMGRLDMEVSLEEV